MDFSHEKEGVIYLAGGCFWGTELLMQSMNGVIDVNLDESQGFSFYDKNVKMPYVIQNRQYYGLKDFRLIMRI